MCTTTNKLVPFGKFQLPRDIWEHLLTFCSLGAHSKIFLLSKSLFQVAFFENDKYKLHYCLNVFSGPRSAYFDAIQIYSAAHFALPALEYVRACFYQINNIPRLFNSKQPIQESRSTPVAPELHRVLTLVLLEAPKFVTVEHEDVLVELIKYLPWKPHALVGHPFPKINQMAMNGIKLASLKQISLALLQTIVPNIEDYANCIMYNDSERNFKYPVLANALCDNVAKKNINETVMLIAQRGHSLMIDMAFGKTKNLKFKNEENVLWLLHSGQDLQLIDKSLLDNPVFIAKAILAQPHVLSVAPDQYKTDESLIQLAISHEKFAALLYASHHLQAKYMTWYLRAIKQHSTVTALLPEHWNDNDQVVRAFVQSWGGNIAHASIRLQLDEQIVALAVQSYPNCYPSLISSMQANKKVLQAVLEIDFRMISHVPPLVIASSPVLQQAKQVMDQFTEAQAYTKGPLQLDEFLANFSKFDFGTI